VIRWATLFAGDVAALLVGRQLLLAIRDRDLIGAPLAGAIQVLIPAGSLHLLELLVAVLLALAVFGTYGPGDRRRDGRTMVKAASAGLLLVCWHWLWTAFSWAHVAGCALMLVGVGSALVTERLAIDALVERFRGVHRSALRAVVLGPAGTARSLLRDPAINDAPSLSLLGYVNTTPWQERDALGNLSDLVQVIDRYRVDALILTGECDSEMYRVVLDIAEAAGCQVLVSPPWAQLSDVDPRLVWQRRMPFVALTRPDLRGQQLVLKRLFDLVVATVGLIVLAPVLALIAVAVRLTSPGPVFFSQIRVGQGGRYFRIFKFRSMVEDAEAKRAALMRESIYEDGRLFKVKDDPRITPLGRFLRRTSLDELPQLWNVLRGDMSLVGPRPPLPSEVSLYSDHHYARFHMKPGITGPWQVAGRNRVTDFEEVVRLEREYMRGWTLRRDLEILVRTIPVVLRMDGAH
jgi:exopolysaccharide biosynthesis polyprenyl glycosylphosphotransferase